jgi:hypothetical protein
MCPRDCYTLLLSRPHRSEIAILQCLPVNCNMEPSVLTVPSPSDFHVHLRQGTMSELVTPHVKKGGFGLAYVMVLDCQCINAISRIAG